MAAAVAGVLAIVEQRLTLPRERQDVGGFAIDRHACALDEALVRQMLHVAVPDVSASGLGLEIRSWDDAKGSDGRERRTFRAPQVIRPIAVVHRLADVGAWEREVTPGLVRLACLAQALTPAFGLMPTWLRPGFVSRSA